MRTRSLLPVDRLLCGYNLLLAAIWSLLLARAPWAPLLVATHLTAAFLPRLLERAPARPSRPMRELMDLYPLLWLGAFWTELDFLRGLRGQQVNDAPIVALEEFLFGAQVSELWMPAMPQVWLSELMHCAYFLYYALIFLPTLVLAISERTPALQDVVFRLMVTYLSCFLIYIAVPVDGPHFLLARHEGPHSAGFFYRLVDAAQGFGDSQGAAFPSSHVAGALTIAYLGWRWFKRPIAILLSVEALGVVLSTVYTQNHYAVDSIAGIVWALALQIVLVPPLARWLSLGREPLRPVPVLPPVSALAVGKRR